MRLWVDDERPMPADFDIHVKTAREAIAQIDTGNITAISLDHDLGEGEDTGYTVACYIEHGAYYGSIGPMKLMVHSANPVGARNIQLAFQEAQMYWNGPNK